MIKVVESRSTRHRPLSVHVHRDITFLTSDRHDEGPTSYTQLMRKKTPVVLSLFVLVLFCVQPALTMRLVL